ncbi:MAG TPA: bi-domain-containing oxidoreductase, partial [Ignavibacteriales bacterium]|nr:bi-domain-containing oxidoreductase [Ignavibacteriales bacterium]
RADLKLGEFAVVIGAGILGLLSVQMLKASGVRVIASDLDNRRLDLAKQLGAELTVNPAQEDIIKAIENFTGGYGADAVLFTAATSSSEPLSQAFKICKKKGRVVLVGVSGMEINRGDIYAKELDFMISTSYGPGRYDRNYEEKGLDYPYAYIRWTENRNMEEYLRLVHSGHINVDLLIDKIYPIAQIEEAFDSLQREGPKPLMVILDYGEFKNGDNGLQQTSGRTLKVNSFDKLDKNIVNIALIGTGSFAKNFHLPNISKLPDKFKIRAVMGRTGHTAKQLAKQYQAEYATTDYDEVLNDPNIDLVLIATRHDSHAELALQALEKGKHVFVEKPLSTNLEDVAKFEVFYADNKNSVKPLLMVGFNRRFSVYAREIKKHTEKRINPLFISYRMNAGYIPLNHWTHEENGRIVGEACHIIDLMNFLTGSQITSISFESITPANEKFSSSDNKSIVLKYADGSVCSLQYFAVGSKEYGKEFMEVHFDEKTIVLDNYKSMKGYGIKIDELQTEKEEKGQFEELSYLYESLKSGKSWPIDLSDIIQTTKASLLISIPEEECSVLNESPVEN